jgi:serine/threonine protein kinase
VRARSLQYNERRSILGRKILDSRVQSGEEPLPQLRDQQYILLNLIGKGGFSEVFRAYDTHAQSFVACKIQYFENSGPCMQAKDVDERRHLAGKHRNYAKTEIASLQKLKHPGIVEIRAAFEDASLNGLNASLCTVMEVSSASIWSNWETCCLL